MCAVWLNRFASGPAASPSRPAARTGAPSTLNGAVTTFPGMLSAPAAVSRCLALRSAASRWEWSARIVRRLSAECTLPCIDRSADSAREASATAPRDPARSPPPAGPVTSRTGITSVSSDDNGRSP
ncbi:hypothetical protein GCM10009559_42770 [Pseudonocardia zijingensis]|uniref:Uncharacterized protein n=1 Tax=Pseudonocardia zijingensis TaxID=153376 RepID=A0ABN1QNL4_9PSEU